jgi:hypothetical protein
LQELCNALSLGAFPGSDPSQAVQTEMDEFRFPTEKVSKRTAFLADPGAKYFQMVSPLFKQKDWLGPDPLRWPGLFHEEIKGACLWIHSDSDCECS